MKTLGLVTLITAGAVVAAHTIRTLNEILDHLDALEKFHLSQILAYMEDNDLETYDYGEVTIHTGEAAVDAEAKITVTEVEEWLKGQDG